MTQQAYEAVAKAIANAAFPGFSLDWRVLFAECIKQALERLNNEKRATERTEDQPARK